MSDAGHKTLYDSVDKWLLIPLFRDSYLVLHGLKSSDCQPKPFYWLADYTMTVKTYYIIINE